MTSRLVQCPAVWSDMRCQLVCNHDSAHSARDQAGLVLSWSNPVAKNGRTVSTQWLPGVHLPAGAEATLGGLAPDQ